MVPDRALVERFRKDLDALSPPGERLGLAVSGGPDSLALLLLCSAARPGSVEAASVDHGLRPESRAEAAMVADLCARLGVPHATLVVEWNVSPSSAIQEQAREARYGALAAWMRDSAIGTLLTAHHLDDQAETLLMRLNRGAGVRGLAGMRPSSAVLGHPELRLLRPLLGWRRRELLAVCKSAGLSPAADPSNDDPRFERVRVRRAIEQADWLDCESLARSASNLAAADEALEWAAAEERSRATRTDEGIVYRPSDAPPEILRRVVERIVRQLAAEGPSELRGRELDRLIAELMAGRIATLRGVRCSGGAEWRFTRANRRR